MNISKTNMIYNLIFSNKVHKKGYKDKDNDYEILKNIIHECLYNNYDFYKKEIILNIISNILNKKIISFNEYDILFRIIFGIRNNINNNKYLYSITLNILKKKLEFFNKICYKNKFDSRIDIIDLLKRINTIISNNPLLNT